MNRRLGAAQLDSLTGIVKVKENSNDACIYKVSQGLLDLISKLC